MKRNQGFTLIELIIVIVILGILAVTAAPKFLNLSNDAQTSVLNGVKASLNSAASMVYGKALIAGKQNAAIGGTDTVTVNTGVTVTVTLGYPKATEADLNKVIDVPEGWVFSSDGATGLVAEASPATAGKIRIGKDAAALAASGCYVEYATPITAGNKPTVTIETTGC